MDNVLVKFDWLHPSQGGRKELPQGAHFVAVGKFPQQSYKEWLNNAWSIHIDWLDKDHPGSWYGLAQFAAPESPNDWLTPGSAIEIFEGPKKIAQVSILTTAKAVENIRRVAA